MNLISLVRGVLRYERPLRVSELPSQGMFYPKDFSIRIKRAPEEDTQAYEQGFNSESIPLTIYKIKNIVKNNTILKQGYVFNDIKSIDIIYIFFEIVKFTKNAPILFSHLSNGEIKTIEFDSKYFNYFSFKDMMKDYDDTNRCFNIDGYFYCLPSIGVEDALIKYLLKRVNTEESNNYVNLFFDFTHFLMNKNDLSDNEIENLIEVFNSDLDESELRRIKNIVSKFAELQKYTLIENGEIIDINSKIDLETIFK